MQPGPLLYTVLLMGTLYLLMGTALLMGAVSSKGTSSLVGTVSLMGTFSYVNIRTLKSKSCHASRPATVRVYGVINGYSVIIGCY